MANELTGPKWDLTEDDVIFSWGPGAKPPVSAADERENIVELLGMCETRLELAELLPLVEEYLNDYPNDGIVLSLLDSVTKTVDTSE